MALGVGFGKAHRRGLCVGFWPTKAGFGKLRLGKKPLALATEEILLAGFSAAPPIAVPGLPQVPSCTLRFSSQVAIGPRRFVDEQIRILRRRASGAPLEYW
jgi:hypothetical protein